MHVCVNYTTAYMYMYNVCSMCVVNMIATYLTVSSVFYDCEVGTLIIEGGRASLPLFTVGHHGDQLIVGGKGPEGNDLLRRYGGLICGGALLVHLQ